jgi:hypothetical protein
MSDVVCGQQWYVDRIFSYRIPKIGAYVDYVPYLPMLGFRLSLGNDMCQ